ncbi:unnamed protein product [Hymenolepis diminuta]|uniref:Uncharacterized protein n=1 Tax=Hymenolepis diminuta TaxID=6216 RepID=A0A564ZE22_HYMDI|nr:unnamed protein product [Hymenolepis diminuta]
MMTWSCTISVRDSGKVIDITQTKVVPVRLVSEPSVPKPQSVSTSCLFDYQTNKKCCLKEHKEGCCTFASSRIHESSIMIKSPKMSELILPINKLNPFIWIMLEQNDLKLEHTFFQFWTS